MRFDKECDISSLKPYGKNPRKHGDDIEGIVKSIEHFGWTNPILVQEGTQRIIAGHGRLEAAQKAGLSRVPVIFLDMNDDDASAYTIADNKLTEMSKWDDAALSSILEELKDCNFDLSLTGFSKDELSEILTPDQESLERTDLDDQPDPPAVATSKVGQIWELGDNRLLCGDSTDPKNVTLAIGSQTADLVFTDPPYGVEYVGKTKKALTIKNDNLGDVGTMRLVTDAAQAWPLKAGGCFYVCGPAGDTETAFRLALRLAGYTLRQCLVWVKNHFVMGRQDYHWRHETILYGWAEGAGHYFLNDRTQDTVMDEEGSLKKLGKAELIDLIKELRRQENTTVWKEDRPTANILHPTIKPIALIQKAVRNSSRIGEIVFDGFGGSGSTLIAAQSIDRRAVLIEADPRYCDAIIERWEHIAGAKAKLISGKK